jgi:hypothetical protein
MTLKMDNKGAINLIDSWSVCGRTRHIDVSYFFLCEAKKKKVLMIEWVKSESNISDLFTKNLNIIFFRKQSAEIVGEFNIDVNEIVEEP